MKITDIRTMRLTGPDTHGIGGIPRNITIELVRVDTDSGIYGLGEAGNFLGDREGIDYCREWLVGRDPLAAGQFVRAMWYGGLPPYNPQMSPTATPTGGIAWAASGVEMALLDIAGKALGTPAYNLLGGAYRDRIRLYVDRSGVADPSDLAAWRRVGEQARDDRFTDMKFDLEWIAPDFSRDPWNRSARIDQINRTVERLMAVREAVGWDVEISVDAHMSYDADSAIRFAQALEPLRLRWFEDPVPILNFDSQAHVRAQTSIPICAGEMLVPDQFREMIAAEAVDIVHPDLLFVGGLHEARKVADYADLNGIPLALHNNGGGVNTIAASHVAAASPNFIGLEVHFWGAMWMGDVVRREGVPLIQDGFVPLTDAPGFGMEIDEAVARPLLAPGESLF
jgi:L-alanine-DL-glutamate epimerase-like enolase superfamily enzyme